MTDPKPRKSEAKQLSLMLSFDGGKAAAQIVSRPDPTLARKELLRDLELQGLRTNLRTGGRR